MTIYDLIYNMSNFCFDVIICNDAKLETDGQEQVFRGDIYDLEHSDIYDRLQDEEVTDIYTDRNGNMYICYWNEEEEEEEEHVWEEEEEEEEEDY